MKDKNTAALLAFFLGWAGAHKFYLGQIGSGIVYFLFSWTGIPWFVAIIEFIMLALMDQDEFNRRFNGARILGAGHPVVVNMLPPAGYGHGYPYGTYPPGQGPPMGQGSYPPGYQPPYGGGPPQPSLPAGQAPQGGQQGSRTRPDLATQLDKLNELRIAGLLTEKEFQQQKTKLLDST
jgi:TM2 domain-containing membrane protein YozV